MTLIWSSIVAMLTLILWQSAIMKLVQAERYDSAASHLIPIAALRGMPVTIIVAFVELAIGIILLVSRFAQVAAITGFLLFLGYAALLLAALARGDNNFDCGCSLVARAVPINGWTIYRPLLLAAMSALAVLLAPSSGQFALQGMLPGLAFYAFYLAANEIDGLKTYRKDVS